MIEAMTSSTDDLTREQRRAAIRLAERTITYGVEHGERPAVADEIADLFPDEKRATFVTVEVGGELNGCIGRLHPTRPIPEDIVANAYRAAFRDQRFDPVGRDDLEALSVHISVLQPLEPVPADSDDEIWEHVDPGRHGLLLQSGERHGTFLPSVWDKCDSREQFLTHLKRKAGLPPSSWPNDLQVFRYTVEEFDRETLRQPQASA